MLDLLPERLPDAETMQEWLTAIERRIEALVREIRCVELEFEAKMAPLRREEERAKDVASHLQRVLSLLHEDKPLRIAERSEPTTRTNGKALPDVAYAVLKDLGKPMFYRDLASHMIERGYAIRGADPGTYLIAYIGKDPRFTRVKRGTYGLAEWVKEEPARKKRKTPKKTIDQPRQRKASLMKEETRDA